MYPAAAFLISSMNVEMYSECGFQKINLVFALNRVCRGDYSRGRWGWDKLWVSLSGCGQGLGLISELFRLELL